MKSYKVSLEFRRTIAYFFLAFLAIVSLFPFFILVVNSTREHGEIMRGFSILPGSALFKNFSALLANNNIPIVRALINSVFISFSSSALCIYFSTLTAYGIYMYRFKGRAIVFNIIMAIMMIPSQVSALGFLRLIMDMKLMDSFIPLIIPSIAAPVVCFYMLQYLQATLPMSVVEAARIDGCNEFVTFNYIAIPMVKPALAVQAIFSFVGCWNNYFMPALILTSPGKRTIPIVIAQLRGAEFMKFDMAQVYMLICIAIIPLVIVYLIFSKFIISGVTTGGVKD